MELLQSCECGQSTIVHHTEAEQLKPCANCSKVNRVPGLKEFVRKMVLLQNSVTPFVDNNQPVVFFDDAGSKDLMDPANIRLTADHLKTSLRKMGLCMVCYANIEPGFFHEIEGLCQHCIDRIGEHIKRRAYRESTQLRRRVDDLQDRMETKRVSLTAAIMYGVLTGFFLGGASAFAVHFFNI